MRSPSKSSDAQHQRRHSDSDQHAINTLPLTITTPPTLTFSLFPHLPTELRLKIWRIAARQPVIVGVASEDENDSSHLVGTKARRHLFAVSAQAREVALKLKDDLNEGMEKTGGAKIYANFDMDTIWLAGITCSKVQNMLVSTNFQRNIKKVKRLAMDLQCLPRTFYTHLAWDFFLMDSVCLDELIIIVDSEEISGDDSPVFIPARRPYHEYGSEFKSLIQRVFPGESGTWDSIALMVSRRLKDSFLCSRTSESNEIPLEQTAQGLNVVKTWTPPVFKFMELVRASSQSMP